jgi:hypothetical protein
MGVVPASRLRRMRQRSARMDRAFRPRQNLRVYRNPGSRRPSASRLCPRHPLCYGLGRSGRGAALLQQYYWLPHRKRPYRYARGSGLLRHRGRRHAAEIQAAKLKSPQGAEARQTFSHDEGAKVSYCYDCEVSPFAQISPTVWTPTSFLLPAKMRGRMKEGAPLERSSP